jgi:SOS-response transcriptional repressor LexA
MLSEKQEKVLMEIEKYIEVNKFSPSVRELCDLLGLRSTSTVHGYLKRLEKEGYIKNHPTLPRTLMILKGTKPSTPMISIRVEDIRKLKELLNTLPEISMPIEDLEGLKETLNSLDI